MKISNIQPYQKSKQNFGARLIKTPALDYLLEKISDDYSKQDAAKLCKRIRNLKPDTLNIKIPEFISNPDGRKLVVEISKNNINISTNILPISESRVAIITPRKIFKSIKKMIKSNSEA